LRWLIEEYRCEVIAFCADLGQGEDLQEIGRRAEKTGAAKVIIEDLREEFVRDFVFPMLRANAVYEGVYLLGTSIARPLIARRQAQIAVELGADAVAHGATGKGNDQLRFELTYAAVAPELKVIAPWRQWEMAGRADLIAYAEKHGIPVPASREKPYSVDRNLLHTSYEGGILEDPWREPDPAMFTVTVAPESAPDKSEELTIAYERGDPVAIDGKKLSPAALLEELNRTGSRHAVGRADLVENRFVGIKSRGVYETPGGTILHSAHRAVESITLDREVLHLRDALIPRYAEMVYYGYWFSPEREMLQAAIDESQRSVTGEARLKLYKGTVTVTGRRSAQSLYDPAVASFEGAGGYDQRDASGFIKLNALRLRARTYVGQKSR